MMTGFPTHHGSRFSRMASAIPTSWGGMICAEFSQYTLYPLSSFGLWEAVTMTPQDAWDRNTMTGQEETIEDKRTGIFCLPNPPFL